MNTSALQSLCKIFSPQPLRPVLAAKSGRVKDPSKHVDIFSAAICRADWMLKQYWFHQRIPDECPMNRRNDPLSISNAISSIIPDDSPHHDKFWIVFQQKKTAVKYL